MPDERSIVRVWALYDGAESEAFLAAQADFEDQLRHASPPLLPPHPGE